MLLKQRFARNTGRLIALLAILALIVAVFVLFVDWQVVAQQLRAADPGYVLAASALLLAALVLYAVRWRYLLGNKPSLRQTFHACNIGHAGNILIPARAGEAARIIVISRGGSVSMTEATSSFVVERLFEQVMRLVALGGAVVYGIGLEAPAATVVGGIAFILLAFAAIRWLVNHQVTVLEVGPRWLARLPRITEARARQSLADLLLNLAGAAAPRRLAMALLWSLLCWGCLWGFFYLVLLALPGAFAPADHLAISLGALALVTPSAPTQPGLYHASLVGPMAAVGFDAAALTAYAIVLHILQMILMIGLALWGLVQTDLSLKRLLPGAGG